ncbi:pectinesterase [Paenibacillus sp. HB172176]|uniref:FIMAH domain-containing protein n=1 Tax=Paenibacillus sp. HB172176 TaxID=2493690 RepID=UPI00143A12E2|nr:pectinesterase [Paenibacillus sp. HB172176]
MKRFSAIILVLAMFLSLYPLQSTLVRADNSMLPAFPGAEGFGYAAVGGRGGEVYHVTSYELTGPGTFHDAIQTAGDTPRTIVFDIAGDITIPQIVARNKSHITIAGQTAPGDGVTIRGNNIRFIDSSDIVIRFLRFRLGRQDFNDDTMYFEDCQNVMIDHSSFSWGTDEVLSIKSKDYDNPRSANITVQWSVISEGLLTHSMGGLVEMNTITMHHNLYAHNNDRNPKTKGVMDFVNNIVYNWGGFPYVAGGESGTKGYGNVVGNYFIAGLNSAEPEFAVVRGNENYQVYLEDNRIDSNKNGVLDGTDTGAGLVEAGRPSVVVPDRFEYPLVHTQSPEVAYDYILDHAGSSLRRDATDIRVINSVRNQTGVIIGDENDAGGFPQLDQGTAPPDEDRDGMPDAWEIANGLDPENPTDRNGDRNEDGYTNLEDYLNELAAPGFPASYPDTPPAWSGPPFTPPPVEPDPEPALEPEPALDGELIRNAVIHDDSGNGIANAVNWSLQSNLKLGDIVFGDRMTGSKRYIFESIPEELLGLEWIRSAVESRSATSSDLLSFFLAGEADVYVAYDSRITTQPEWLTSEYEDTGETITDSQPVTYELYRKRYGAGSRVVMGPNNNKSKCPYFVIVKPANEGTAPLGEAPAGLDGSMIENAAVSLNWTSVDGAQSYLVYRASSKNPNFKAIASAEEPSFADATSEKGVAYEYRVSALNAGGESPLSSSVEALIYDAAQPAPAAPTGLAAAAVRSLSVKLSWTPVEAATSYLVYRAIASEGDFVKVGSTAAAGFADRSVDPSTVYVYKVSAIGIGGESERSADIEVRTKEALILPGKPAGLKTEAVSTSSFDMSWNAVDEADTYNVYRKADGEEAFSLIASVESASYSDDSVSVGKAGYTYRIAAVNEMGESGYSDELPLDMPVPEAPTDLIVGKVGEDFVGLIWTSHGGESIVNVYREAGGVVEQVGTAKVSTFYDRTAEPGTTYTYTIKAENAAGESEASNSVQAKPGLMTVLDHYTEQFKQTGDVTGPLAAKLTNALKQVRHHLEKGSLKQAIHFLKKYEEQLHDASMQQNLSLDARWTLTYYADLLMMRLEEM